MDPMKGLVSVIIPTYNRYELLNHSIKSVLANTYKEVEVIVINDCSTDPRYYSGELEKHDKTTVIHLPVNMRIKHNALSAQGITKNYGLECARGEWIAFLDDDDFFLENKLEAQLSYMLYNNCKFSSTNMYVINHISVCDEKLDFNIISKYFQTDIPQVFNNDIIHRTNYINNSSVMIHHSIVNKAGKFNIIQYEDWDYWKRAIQYADCLYINEPLVYYTKTINNSESVRYYN